MSPFETFLILSKLIDRAKDLRRWDKPLESLDQMNDVLREVFENETLAVMRARYVPINRQNLIQTVASNLGLHDVGQPAASIHEVAVAIDQMIITGRLIEREADCDQTGPTKFYIVELPLLDRLALEG